MPEALKRRAIPEWVWVAALGALALLLRLIYIVQVKDTSLVAPDGSLTGLSGWKFGSALNGLCSAIGGSAGSRLRVLRHAAFERAEGPAFEPRHDCFFAGLPAAHNFWGFDEGGHCGRQCRYRALCECGETFGPTIRTCANRVNASDVNATAREFTSEIRR